MVLNSTRLSYVLCIFASISITCCYAVTIQCSELYSYSYYASTGEVFVCHDDSSLLNVDDSSAAIVDKILHPNGSEVENIKQINYLLIEDARGLKLVPDGVKHKLPSLKAIHFENCGISYVDKFNLQQFGDDLIKIDLVGNSLIFLPADLFEFTQNLKFIRFSGNPLKFIESRFFDNLHTIKNVEAVEIISCGCIDQKFTLSKFQELEDFKWNSERCSDFWIENFIHRKLEKRLSLVEAKLIAFEEKFMEIATFLQSRKEGDMLQSFEEKLVKVIKSVIHN